MATDWTKIRTEYVHGTETMRELAARHGIKSAGLMRRAAAEGWDAARKQHSAEVSKRAAASIVETKVDELVAFNADDLKVARALRASVAAHIRASQQEGSRRIAPADLRALASAAEASQRIGRLALGAATENKTLTGPDGGPVQAITRIEIVARKA